MLHPENTVLVIVDAQTKLLNVMFEKDFLISNLQKLVKGVQAMGIPIVATEQNPEGLGPTIPDVAQVMPGIKPIRKISWSCWCEKSFSHELESLNRRQILITGAEAHVCVYQTAMDLLDSGYDVYMVADCVGSRTARNRDIALSRTVNEGAKLTSMEMALFELLKTAANPQFKEILKIVK
jgi:nicotinamidase-related amidase